MTKQNYRIDMSQQAAVSLLLDSRKVNDIYSFTMVVESVTFDDLSRFSSYCILPFLSFVFSFLSFI